jgi:hypothetical protein
MPAAAPIICVYACSSTFVSSLNSTVRSCKKKKVYLLFCMGAWNLIFSLRKHLCLRLPRGFPTTILLGRGGGCFFHLD